MIKNIISTCLMALFLATTGTAYAQAPACDRACVTALVENYVAALVRHDPAGLPLAADLRVTENGALAQTGTGIWQSITARGTYSQTFVDDSLESAVFFGAFSEGTDPLLLAIRFKLEGGLIAEIENLVSRADERNQLILRHQLTEPNPVFEIVLPPEQRSTRDELIAAGHSYFDALQYHRSDIVDMHNECLRRENGVILLRNPDPTQPCPGGFERFSYMSEIRDRRLAVIDEARGLVLMFAFFDVPGNVEVTGQAGPSDVAAANGAPQADTRRLPRSLFIAELFRVVDGKIRDIDAVMFNLDLGAQSNWQ